MNAWAGSGIIKAPFFRRFELDKKPKIRQIEALPVDTPRGRIVVLRDPLGFSPAVLQVSREAFFIISLLDGTRDVRDIQAQVMRQFGELLYSDRIEDLVEQLDTCYFLDNKRYGKLQQETIGNFLNSSTRAPSHAGTAYPDTERELMQTIAKMFTAEGGAGEIDWKSGERGGVTVRGLVVPHIDLERGGVCYSFGYRELAENSQAQTYVVLGTAHCEMKNPYCLTKKDFETPLGTLANDREFSDELHEACPWLQEDEFSHRSEHSIEFQAVLLQYLFGKRRTVKIVPILCGSLHKQIEKDESPADNPQITGFLEALKEAFSKRGESVCMIAGADLSHVGQRFGDPVMVNDQLLTYLEERDRKTLELVQKVDADGFYHEVTQDGDKRKICGLPNIYTMLHVLGKGEGKLLKYGQAPDEQTNSVVTFASLVVK